jgi:hypothetical protein
MTRSAGCPFWTPRTESERAQGQGDSLTVNWRNPDYPQSSNFGKKWNFHEGQKPKYLQVVKANRVHLSHYRHIAASSIGALVANCASRKRELNFAIKLNDLSQLCELG